MARLRIVLLLLWTSLLGGCAATLKPEIQSAPWTASVVSETKEGDPLFFATGAERFAAPSLLSNSKPCQWEAAKEGHRFEVVYFATNREEIAPRNVLFGASSRRDVRSFGEKRSTSHNTYGCSYVNIPLRKRGGTIDQIRPETVTEETSFAESKFFVRDVRLISSGDFPAEVASAAQKAKRFKGQILVFVHGFNNTFESALVRAAQLKHDMDFDGPVVVFSWPSRGDAEGYLYDRNAADISNVSLLDLLKIVAPEFEKGALTILAHSMGGRLLLSSLDKGIGESDGSQYVVSLGELILASPAVDWDFFNDKMQRIGRSKIRMSVYCNEKDEALKVAEWKIAEGKKMVGRCPDGAEPDNPHNARIDFMDITAATDCEGVLLRPLGPAKRLFTTECTHNTYALSGYIIADLNQLIRTHAEPPIRSGQWTTQYRIPPISKATGYYQFRPGT